MPNPSLKPSPGVFPLGSGLARTLFIKTSSTAPVSFLPAAPPPARRETRRQRLVRSPGGHVRDHFQPVRRIDGIQPYYLIQHRFHPVGRNGVGHPPLPFIRIHRSLCRLLAGTVSVARVSF